jgi:hypothetical protein
MPGWTCQGCGVRVEHESEAVRPGCAAPPGWRLVTAAGFPVCSWECERVLVARLEDPLVSSDGRRRPVCCPRGG